MHAGVDFLHDPLRNHAVAFTQLKAEEELGRLSDRQVAHFTDRLTTDLHRQRRRLETGTAARRAGDLAHVRLHCFTRPVGLSVGMAALEPRDSAFVLGFVLAAAAVAVLVTDRDLALRSVKNQLHFRLRERGVWRVDVDVVGLAH